MAESWWCLTQFWNNEFLKHFIIDTVCWKCVYCIEIDIMTPEAISVCHCINHGLVVCLFCYWAKVWSITISSVQSSLVGGGVPLWWFPIWWHNIDAVHQSWPRWATLVVVTSLAFLRFGNRVLIFCHIQQVITPLLLQINSWNLQGT